MILIYNFLIFILSIFLLPILIFKILTDQNLKANLSERFAFFPFKFKEKVIWFHASSVGEVNITTILAKKLKEKYPSYFFIITTMTITGREKAVSSNLFNKVLFVPFDFYFFVKKFIKKVNPELILIAETEFWPNIFYLADKKLIPLVVFNCRVSDKSFKNYYKLKSFFEKVLNFAKLFLCQNQVYAERLKLLGVKKEKIKVTGNIKFDIDLSNIDKEKSLEIFNLKKIKEKYLILTCGSTHEGEEEIFFDILKNIKDIFLILAPRHIDRVPKIEEIAKDKGITFCKLSDNTKNIENVRVLIIDKIGYLVNAYSISDIAFIGGSLVSIGGHNPLEAVFFKIPIISGKNIFNFIEVYNLLKKHNGCILVNDKKELEYNIKKLIKDESFRKQIGENGYKVLNENKGSLDKTIAELDKFLL